MEISSGIFPKIVGEKCFSLEYRLQIIAFIDIFASKKVKD